MKRPATTDVESLECVTQKEISAELTRDLERFVVFNRSRDYYLLKQKMSENDFVQTLKSLLFIEKAGDLVLKKNNPFFRAMDSVVAVACSRGNSDSYAFQIVDNPKGVEAPSNDQLLEPFVLTLLCEPSDQFRVIVNRVYDQLSFNVENLFSQYGTLDLRTISSNRIVNDLGMQYGIATEHYIYRDILVLVEKYFPNEKLALKLIENIPFDSFCHMMSVGSDSFLDFMISFFQRNNIEPHAVIEKNKHLLLRKIIVSGSINVFHHPIEQHNKLERLFSHISKREYLQQNFIVGFLHPLVDIALRTPTAVAFDFLLAKVTLAQSPKQLFEQANYQLFMTAFKCQNVEQMALVSSLLPDEQKRKLLALMHLLVVCEIYELMDCWASSRSDMLKWLEKLFKKCDKRIEDQYGPLWRLMQERQKQYSQDSPESYIFSEEECQLLPPNYSQDNEVHYEYGIKLKAKNSDEIQQQQQFIKDTLPSILVDFTSWSTNDWLKELGLLFGKLQKMTQYPQANYLAYKFLPLPDLVYQQLLRDHLDITDIERPNIAIEQYLRRNNFRAPLWSHQLDLQHPSKMDAQTCHIIGALWHAAVLKKLHPLYNAMSSKGVKKNIAVINITVTLTNNNGKRVTKSMPFNVSNRPTVYCLSKERLKKTYDKYKAHGKKVVDDSHTYKEDQDITILHSEKTFVHQLDQQESIDDFAEQLRQYKKLHSIVLDIVSTNQCCKSCQLMLIGLQNSHYLVGGFIARLTQALNARGVITPTGDKIIRVVTRYSSFQPINSSDNRVIGNTPDKSPKFRNYFQPNTIFHSSSYVSSILPRVSIFDERFNDQFAQSESYRQANTLRDINQNSDAIVSEYQPKEHALSYCGTNPLSIKQLCADSKNRVLICAPQKSTELYFRKPPSMAISLEKFSLLCSGTSTEDVIEQEWLELRK